MKKSSICVKGIMIALFWAVSLFCVSCGGEGQATDMKLARAEGDVGIRDEQERTVTPEENLGLYSGYQIDTEQNSYAWINLDSVKLARMDQGSAVEIRKSGKKLEIQLASGSIYFNIKEPLEEDETLEIRTSTMAVGIRGTIGWVESMDETHMKVSILEGTVQCTIKDPETGEEVTANVSPGETALLILQPGEDEIVIDRIQEEDLPEFVQAELREDSQAAERAEAASGIVVEAEEGEDSGDNPGAESGEAGTESGEAGGESESGTEEAEGSDTAETENNGEVLQAYLENQLVPRYGYADVTAKEASFAPISDYYYEIDNAWTGLSGIAEARVMDLDSDGNDEMIVVVVNNQQITMEVYEVENNVPVKKGEITDDRMEQIGMGDDCFYEKVLSVVEAGGKKYLLYTSKFTGFVTGDGYFSYVMLYQYDGERLFAPLAIIQNSLGSAEFAYNAFRYDENGNVLNEEVIYDEDEDNGEGLDEAYCHGRMEALFGEYGIALGGNASMVDGIFDSFLAPDTEHEELLKLQMEGELQGEQAMYYFNS